MDTNPSKLEGNAHLYTFDLETQGLRTRSFTKGWFRGRSAEEPIQISSISYGASGKKAHINAFTDIISPELLKRHRVTAEMLDAGDLPDSLLNEITRTEHSRYDPTQAPRWDPSLRTRGSVIDQVFRRHAKQVMRGEGVMAQADVYQKLVDEWSGISAGGGKVQLGAWNVGYDMPTLFREIRRHGHGDKLNNLLKSNSIEVREMAESLHAMRFEGMLRSNWTPMMTDRAAAMAAIDKGISAITPENAKSLGAVVEHRSLRDLVDDIRGGRDAFKARASKWVQSKRSGSAQAQAVAEDVVNRLSNIKDWNSFKEFVEYGHKNANQVVFGEKTLRDVLGEMYGNGSHAHILGDTRTLQNVMHFAPMQGKFSAFNFVAGGRLTDVAGVLTRHSKELEVGADTVTELHSLIAGAHEADTDRTLMERTAVEIDRIRKHDHLFEKWVKFDQQASHEASVRRVGELYQDLVHGSAGAPQRSAAEELAGVLHGGGKRLKSSYGKVGKTGPWLGVALGVAAMYMVGKHNETEKPPKIEGFRQPRGDWDSIEGINASELPFSNISAFGSGRDHFYGMVTASHLSNPWVNNWRQRRKTNDRSAAEGTMIGAQVESELMASGYGHNQMMVYAMGGSSAVDFMLNDQIPLELKTTNKMPNAVKQEHMGQIQFDLAATQQPYGYVMYIQRSDPQKRRIFRVEADAQRLSYEMATLGQQINQDHAVEGYKVVPYMKMRMNQYLGQAMNWLHSIPNSAERAPDPFLWTALGTVSTMTDEDEIEDNAGESEQPVGYSGLRAQAWRNTGYAGLVQNLSEDAIGHGVRDHATQLHRLPGMPRTLRGRRSYAKVCHAERASMMGA